jgi:hypothetical protein
VQERVRLAFKLTIVYYLAGCVGSTIGSFLNPISMLLVANAGVVLSLHVLVLGPGLEL